MLKTIPGYSNYAVDSDGNVWVVRSSRRKQLPFLMTPRAGRIYKKIGLTGDDGRRHEHTVNRLVALAFHGQPPTPEHDAAHSDGNSMNNRADNIQWKTPLENNLDRITHGTMPRGENHKRSKVTESDVRDIFNRLAAGEKERPLAREYGLSKAAVHFIKTGQNWAHLNLVGN